MGLIFKLFIGLGVSTFIGIGVFIGVVRQSYRDPITPYLAMLPGQAVEGLMDYPCRLRAIPESSQEIGYCQFAERENAFHDITLNTFHHVITRMTAYDIQPGALRLGDLILCWGSPSTISNHFPDITVSLDLYWSNHVHAQVNPVRYAYRLDYSLSVSYLSVEDGWQPAGDKAFVCKSA